MKHMIQQINQSMQIFEKEDKGSIDSLKLTDQNLFATIIHKTSLVYHFSSDYISGHYLPLFLGAASKIENISWGPSFKLNIKVEALVPDDQSCAFKLVLLTDFGNLHKANHPVCH